MAEPIYTDTERRFWAKVRKTDGCWEWTAAKQSKGYEAPRWPVTRETANREGIVKWRTQ